MKDLKNEIWKDIPEYEGLYQVSNFGRIKNIKNIKEKIFTQRNTKNTYINICLIKNNIKKSYKIHRLVAITFILNPKNKPCVNHKNGLKYDNRVENLEWCTHSENNFDRWRNQKNKRVLIFKQYIPHKELNIKLTVGLKFNMLTTIKKLENNYWLFLCDCGNTKKIKGSSVTTGHTKSCGCIKKEKIAESTTTHNLSKTKEYAVWCSIKSRCYNLKNKFYFNYGGRGIKMSIEWKNSFEIFLKDMGKRPIDKHSIDRINNDGDYCKENCRWSTRVEQQNNTRKTVKIEYNNKIKSLKDWCRELNIPYKRVESRIKLGWSIKDVFETPVKKETNKLNKEKVSEIKQLLNKNLKYKEIAKIFNVDPTMIGLIARNKSWKNVE